MSTKKTIRAIKTWWGDWMHCWRQFILCLDQTLNCASGLIFPSRQVWADETISSRAGRLIASSPYKYYARLIDFLFRPFQGPNHCRNAYEKEKARYNFPPEMRT